MYLNRAMKFLDDTGLEPPCFPILSSIAPLLVVAKYVTVLMICLHKSFI